MKQKRIMDFQNVVLYSTMIATNIHGDVLKGIAGEPIETVGGLSMTFKITNGTETQFIPRLLDSSEPNVLKLPNLYGLNAYIDDSVTVSFAIIQKKFYAVLCSNGKDTAVQHMFPVDFDALVYLPHSIEFNGRKNKEVIIDPLVINDGLGFTIDVSETAMVHIAEDDAMADNMKLFGLLPHEPKFIDVYLNDDFIVVDKEDAFKPGTQQLKDGYSVVKKEIADFDNPLADDAGMTTHETRYANQYVRKQRDEKRKQINAIKADSERFYNVFPIVFYWKHFNMSCNHRLNDFAFPLFKTE